MRYTHLVLLLLLPLSFFLGLSSPINAEDPAVPASLPLDWTSVDEDEVDSIVAMLESDYWHLRMFALMRLVRFTGEGAHELYAKGFADPDWHVRAFSLLYAEQAGVKPVLSASEIDPYVLRAAIAVGIDVPSELLAEVAKTMSRERDFEKQLFALELMVLADQERSVKRAGRSLSAIIGRMKDADARLYGWRISRILGGEGPSNNRTRSPADDWRTWLKEKGGSLTLDKDKLVAAYRRPQNAPQVATIDFKKFDYVYNYADQLVQNDLELAVLIDATGSMGSEIQACQLQVDRIINVLGHLSNRMRVAFVAYRDHSDGDKVEVAPLTDKVAAVRRFLLGIEAKGGGDQPESLLLGLKALTKFRWSREANRHIVVIADAEDRPDERDETKYLLSRLTEDFFSTHYIEVRSDKLFPHLHEVTQRMDGRRVQQKNSDELGMTILKLTLDPQFAPSVDDFYHFLSDWCL